MSKYVNADLLRKDIDNWKEAMADAVGEYSDGVRFALTHFTFVFDSLQQEQPEVDFEEEMDKFFEEMPIQEHENIFEDTYQMIARHFYELGLKARKEK